ncbi:MAG: DUF433 domain-containing protein [Dehalococcoidia bacterium]
MYEARIVTDPNILVGKPIVRGTRVPVELVLKRLAQDLDVRGVLKAYPRLTEDDIRACIEYAQVVIEGEEIFPAAPSSR